MKHRVAVSMCAYAAVDLLTCADLVQLMQKTRTADVHFNAVEGSQISRNRTRLVECARLDHASHVLFVDADMRFPGEACDRLLARRAPIVGANYRWRSDPRRFTSGVTSYGRSGVERVESIGFGCALIELAVFDRLAIPWFQEPWSTEDGSYLTDDVWFCRAARDRGINVLVDHDLSQFVKHIGSTELSVNG